MYPLDICNNRIEMLKEFGKIWKKKLENIRDKIKKARDFLGKLGKNLRKFWEIFANNLGKFWE